MLLSVALLTFIFFIIRGGNRLKFSELEKAKKKDKEKSKKKDIEKGEKKKKKIVSEESD